jgi:hypothetical protein
MLSFVIVACVAAIAITTVTIWNSDKRGFNLPLFISFGLIIGVPLAFGLLKGLWDGRPLFGYPTSGAILTSGGFHCAGDGPKRIHYHTCAGPPAMLPEGSRPADFPYADSM